MCRCPASGSDLKESCFVWSSGCGLASFQAHRSCDTSVSYVVRSLRRCLVSRAPCAGPAGPSWLGSACQLLAHRSGWLAGRVCGCGCGKLELVWSVSLSWSLRGRLLVALVAWSSRKRVVGVLVAWSRGCSVLHMVERWVFLALRRRESLRAWLSSTGLLASPVKATRSVLVISLKPFEECCAIAGGFLSSVSSSPTSLEAWTTMRSVRDEASPRPSREDLWFFRDQRHRSQLRRKAIATTCGSTRRGQSMWLLGSLIGKKQLRSG